MSNAAPARTGQHRGLAQRAGHEADQRLPPVEIGGHLHRSSEGRGGQGGRPADPVGRRVGRDPDRIARQLRRVGEEDEGARHQRGIQHIHAGSAEDLLAHHDAERDAQGHLPERNRRRQDQREQHAGDEKALVQLVLPHHREEQLPETADGKGDDQDRQVIEAAVHEAAQQVVRREAEAERLHGAGLPRRARRRAGGDGQVRLVAGVVQRHPDAAGQRDDDGHHHPLQVEPVAHVGRAGGDLARGIEKAVLRFPERVETFELAARFEVMRLRIEQAPQEFHGRDRACDFFLKRGVKKRRGPVPELSTIVPPAPGASQSGRRHGRFCPLVSLPPAASPAPAAGAARSRPSRGRRRCRGRGPPRRAPGSRAPRHARRRA